MYEAAWARANGAADRPARADGEAVRVQDVPRRHRDGAAGVRRRRLHGRVRHPALLPAGQAAADLVVGRPRRSKSWSPPACSARSDGRDALAAGAHASTTPTRSPRRSRPRSTTIRSGAGRSPTSRGAPRSSACGGSVFVDAPSATRTGPGSRSNCGSVALWAPPGHEELSRRGRRRARPARRRAHRRRSRATRCWRCSRGSRRASARRAALLPEHRRRRTTTTAATASARRCSPRT